MKLYAILKESFKAKETELTDDSRLMAMEEWDSLSHMYFITKLEENFGIELTGDEISGMQTVGDVKNIITSKGKSVE